MLIWLIPRGSIGKGKVLNPYCEFIARQITRIWYGSDLESVL